jgi:outer membrane receptor protein involved in Fe transport
MMTAENVLSRSVRLLFAAGMALGAAPASAQDGAEAPEQRDDGALQRVEVTGSRIPALNTEGSSPVTTLGARDIRIDGQRNVEDLLNNLPQVFASQGAAIANGASGTATVNLRGMGVQRTLVLVNGKRLPPGNVLNNAADLNQIPTQLIRRVDLLTGGAGAVYGSGAVAGVVNFIMKDDFQGLELEANVSGANHRQHNDQVQSLVRASNYPLPGNHGLDARKYDFSLLAGANFADNKGNATFFVAHRHADALLQSERDFSSCSIGAANGNLTCAGSGTGVARVGTFTPDANGNPRLYTAADAYNFSPMVHYQRPSDEVNVNSMLHYDLGPAARLYSEFSFHNYTTDAQIAPAGIFYGQSATIAYENPLLNAAWRAALGLSAPGKTARVFVGKRNTEGGPRTNKIADTSFREVLGVKGSIGDWNYDLFGQFARVNHSDVSDGYFSNRLIARALDVVADAGGKPVCRAVLDGSDPKCVPYNLYTPGAITQAALDYLQVSGSAGGHTQQSVFGLNAGTDLSRYGLKLPTAESGVGVSIGYEQRVEKLSFEPDYENQSGDLSGSAGARPAAAGAYNVKEAFGEFKVPLLAGFALARRLDLNGSYRRSHYSIGADTHTWGLGLDWEPIQRMRVRASAQHAVRAPGLNELYAGQAMLLVGPRSDPCGGTKPTATAEQCAWTGLPAALYGRVPANSTSQYNGLTGGNPDVKPETANTYTVGLVLTPLRDLTITLDAYQLKIKDAIQAYNAQSAFDQCLATGNPLYCKLIHRDAAGSLWLTQDGYVEAGTTNIGSQGSSGLDLGVGWRRQLAGYGGLDVTLNGTWLRSYTVENLPGAPGYDCAGLYGPTCGIPLPTWRHKLRATWSTPWDVDLSATWRYFGRVKNELLDSAVNVRSAALATQADAWLASRSYLDLGLAWRYSRKVVLNLGISNLFDKDPPIASSNSATSILANGNTYPQVYDTYGRFVHANLTWRF